MIKFSTICMIFFPRQTNIKSKLKRQEVASTTEDNLKEARLLEVTSRSLEGIWQRN